jgi:hypothetical protein
MIFVCMKINSKKGNHEGEKKKYGKGFSSYSGL